MSVDALPVAELLRTIPDPLYVLDEHFRFAFVNEPASQLLDAPPDALLGRLVWDAFPRRTDPILRQLRRAMRERRTVAVTAYDRPLQRWFSVRAVPYRHGLAVFFHDVTDVKRAEEHWARIAEIRTALHRIAAQVAADAPAEETYELVCAESLRLVGAGGSWLLRLDGDEYCVLAHAIVDGDVEDPDVRGRMYPVPRGGHLQRMRDSDRSVVVPDRVRGALASAGLRAAILVPVRLGGTVWGGLVVGWASPRPDARDALPWLEELTQLVSAGISSAEARAELARRAATDGLTGLANRRALDEQLEHSVGRARRLGRPFTFAVLDVDEFKLINDGYGHEVGDHVLRVVAERLEAVTRDEDVAARMGGDEFALVLEGSDAGASLVVVRRLRAAIAAALRERGLPAATVSVGLCAWRPGVTPVELKRHADAALYRAKRRGRDAAQVEDAPVALRAPRA